MRIRAFPTIATALRVLVSNLPSFFVIGLLFSVPNILVGVLSDDGGGRSGTSNFVGFVLAIASMLLVAGGAMPAVLDAIRGTPSPIGTNISRAISRIGSILLVSLSLALLLACILYASGAVLGALMVDGGLVRSLPVVFFMFVLILAPAIFLLAILFVSVPVAAVEGVSVGRAFDRSSRLTRGSRAATFALGYLLLLPYLFLMVGVLMILQHDPARLFEFLVFLEENAWAGYLLAYGLPILFALFGGVVMGVVYHDARQGIEDVSTEQMADVFA